MRSIGLMSGTSMDGIDVALLDTDGTPSQLNELAHTILPYSSEFKTLLKAAEFAVRHHKGDLNSAKKDYPNLLEYYLRDKMGLKPAAIETRLRILEHYLPLDFDAVVKHSTVLHAAAVRKLLQEQRLSTNDIDVVGYHGQTLYHAPHKKLSIIVGDGDLLAQELQISVVDDFRRKDIEAGGFGAPFAPLYHQALAIRDHHIPLAVVNCGGIANLSLILSDHEQDLIGFDTGPGNGLVDQFVRQRTQGREFMDQDGRYGLSGRVNQSVFAALFEKAVLQEGQNYFLKPSPKALDLGDLYLIDELNALSLEDGCATLETFTALSLVESLKPFEDRLPQQFILAGGGWNNPVILRALRVELANRYPRVTVKRADELGWNSQAMEAQIFAYFAVRSLQNLPLSFPGTTGIPRPMSGGRLSKAS